MQTNKAKGKKMDTRQKCSISALFCPFPKYIWTMQEEQKMGLV